MKEVISNQVNNRGSDANLIHKKTIVYIVSQINHSELFYNTAVHLKQEEKWNIVFILLHKSESPFEFKLKELGLTVHRIYYQSKKNIFPAILKIRKLLKKIRPVIVHTHLFEAGFAGMIAARLAGVKHRIHTRHDAMIHHAYHPQAVKYDKFINRLATKIVAISGNVRTILTDLENVPAEKIITIPHGFSFDKMHTGSEEEVHYLKDKYPGLKEASPIIGCVSRLIEWKGVQYLIPAFKNILSGYPDAHLVLANASGPYEKKIREMLREIPERNYTLIKFEPRIFALFRLMDVFVHLPVDYRSEAFGQVYIEAMYSKTPVVATLSGIGSEILVDRKNALVVNYRDSKDVEDKILLLLGDKLLRERISGNAREAVTSGFSIENMMNDLNRLYDSLY